MRADFYSKASHYANLAAALSEHQLLVGPLTSDELRRAIERPAQLASCELEPGLAERLLQDAREQSGGLPQLSDVLLELWQRRVGGRLTHRDYEDIGGIEGALKRRAEDVYSKVLNAHEQRLCQRIFLRLVEPGEGTEDTRCRVNMEELLPTATTAGPGEAIVQKLSAENARLIIIEEKDQKRCIEIAHEALIRCWPRLRDWVNINRTDLLAHRRLSEATHEWIGLNRDPSALYRGIRLARACEWVRLHPDEIKSEESAFLNASIELEFKIRLQPALSKISEQKGNSHVWLNAAANQAFVEQIRTRIQKNSDQYEDSELRAMRRIIALNHLLKRMVFSKVVLALTVLMPLVGVASAFYINLLLGCGGAGLFIFLLVGSLGDYLQAEGKMRRDVT